jgi:hypothetical protein
MKNVWGARNISKADAEPVDRTASHLSCTQSLKEDHVNQAGMDPLL